MSRPVKLDRILGLPIRDTALVHVTVLVDNRLSLFGIIRNRHTFAKQTLAFGGRLIVNGSRHDQQHLLRMVPLTVLQVEPAIMYMNARNPRGPVRIRIEDNLGDVGIWNSELIACTT